VGLLRWALQTRVSQTITTHHQIMITQVKVNWEVMKRIEVYSMYKDVVGIVQHRARCCGLVLAAMTSLIIRP
jgi:hypothetical protein